MFKRNHIITVMGCLSVLSLTLNTNPMTLHTPVSAAPDLVPRDDALSRHIWAHRLPIAPTPKAVLATVPTSEFIPIHQHQIVTAMGAQ